MRKEEHMSHHEHHKHDANFKHLMNDFIKKFIKLFYPVFYESLDDRHQWLPLSEDVTSKYRHLKRNDVGNNYLDRAYLVPTNNEEFVVIHLEFQSTNDDMGKRIRKYRKLIAQTYVEDIAIVSILIGFNEFKELKTKEYHYDFSKYGLNSKETSDYDLINLSDERWHWKDAMFYNEKNPNEVAIAFWGLISNNEVIKQDGVNMMLDGYRFLADIQKYSKNPELIIRPFKFLDDYVLPRLSNKQIVEFEHKLKELKETNKGEMIVELIKVAQRGLGYKGESTRFIEEQVNKLLEEYNVHGKDKISAFLETTFDELVFVNSLKLLQNDKSGDSLKNYLKIQH